MPLLIIPALIAGGYGGWKLSGWFNDDEQEVVGTTVVVNNTQDNKSDNLKLVLIGVATYVVLKKTKMI